MALASGDPVGPVDQWPGAIDAFLEVAHTYGWVPAVVGTSEEGATTWNQAGFEGDAHRRRSHHLPGYV